MDTIRIIHMAARLTDITAQSGFRAASLSVRARGIADGDIRIGIVDSIAPVSTAEDTMAADLRDGALKVVALTDTADLKVVMASAAANRAAVVGSAAANRAVEADSTAVADLMVADAGNGFRLGK
jgi:hypothetical protein